LCDSKLSGIDSDVRPLRLQAALRAQANLLNGINLMLAVQSHSKKYSAFAVALLAVFRRRLGLRLRTWRIAHMFLAIVIVVGSVVHGILIEGTMETVSKAALCALVLAATVKVMAGLRVWRKRGTLRGESIARQ
jgi:predicted ferric reductase